MSRHPVKRTPADRAAIMRELARSAAAAPDHRPVYHAVSRATGVQRNTLRRWWDALEPAEQARLRSSAAQTEEAAKPKPTAPAVATPEVRTEVALLLGRPDDDPLVTIGVDLRVERDRTESDGPRAAATKEYSRFLVTHRAVGGRTGPMTPDEHIARCREWVEPTIEAVLGSPEILNDERIWAAVDAAREGA